MFWSIFLIACSILHFQKIQAWEIKGGSLWYNKTTPFYLRGVNWFGYETECHIVHGLWINTMDSYFQILSDTIKMNALRIPFSFETIANWENPPKSDCVTANPWLQTLSIRDSLHILFQKATDHHMAILLDFHTIEDKITDYLVSDTVTLEQTFFMWEKIVREFHIYDNFMGIDLKNEPHGSITWNEWGAYVSRVIKYVHGTFPQFRGFFFVEGVQDFTTKSVWGGSFTGLQQNMIHVIPHRQIVFSPHIYGNSIRGDIANNDTDDLFDYWFGNIRFQFPLNAIVIGEIGGMNIGDDFNWHQKIKEYLKKRELRNAFYWCLNPNSYDTGGILQYDWRTIDERKTLFHYDLQPNSTMIEFNLPHK